MMRNWHLNILRSVTRLDFIRQSSNRNMSGIKKIAVCQMTSVADKAKNMEVVSSLISNAAKEDVQMLFFPEACDYLCDNKNDTLNFAEPIIGGATVGSYRKLAAQYNVWLSMGGVHEKDVEHPAKVSNTHIIIDNKGNIVQTYRKLHLFDVEIPERNIRLKESDFCVPGNHIVAPVDTPIGKVGNIVQTYRKLHLFDVEIPERNIRLKESDFCVSGNHIVAPVDTPVGKVGNIVQTYRKLDLFDVEIPERNIRLKESDFCVPGNHIVAPVDTPVGKVGLAICYDMRFPELSTSLSIMKAEVLTYPSAFTQHTGAAHWHVLLRARAIENQCYVIAAAQSGTHNAKRKSYGHAVCIDPWGEVLADCEETSPCYKVVEISEDKLQDVRRNMPVFQHRRRNVYSLYCLSVRKDLLSTHKEPSESSGSKLPDTPCGPETPDEPSYAFGHVKVPETCVFFKSKLTYAFVNLRCVIPGHVLVAPIRTAERNKDLSEEEAQDFYKTIRIVQSLMEKVHSCESCTVTIQDGEAAGRTVHHLHCHIMPRKKGDFIDNDLIYLELAKHDQ
ncbi:hypothetical protein PYW07_011368 [Mythimna separata]|uniref:bis(5'-adenosyl)-triphosphatase n=1 Tax=Mythimna separata TaxID=271217 RepID=A0AAD7Y9A5_MYTSE|nr:hypothetical protein PYW07_011368 [Mythimna separata]